MIILILITAVCAYLFFRNVARGTFWIGSALGRRAIATNRVIPVPKITVMSIFLVVFVLALISLFT